MRKSIVLSIFKKEMIDILRDKKTLFMAIILPIIMYPILIILVSQIMMISLNKMQQKELPIAFNKSPNKAIMEKILEGKENEGKLKIINVKDYREALEQREITAYIEIGEEKEQTSYKIYMNSSVEDSNTSSIRIKNLLRDYKNELTKEKIEAMGLDSEIILEPIIYETINIAKNEEMAGYLIGQILPFILIIGVLMGAIYPAIDVMAGEKERGTLETLLTLPISNGELIMGKYLAVSISAITSAILSVLSIALSMGFLLASFGETGLIGMEGIKFNELIFPLIVTLICICLFAMVVSAVSMSVCSLAKNFKEAQNYITPIMFIVMIPSYASIIPSMELNGLNATIPVVNISLLIKGVLSFRYDIALIAIVLVTNIAFVLLSGFILSKMFDSEEVLFGGSREFSFLESRSNIKKHTFPTISDGLVLYAALLLVLVYLGSFLQIKYKLVGIALTQIIIILVPLLFGYYIKTDFRKTFSIKIPKFKHILGGMSIWTGGFIASLLIAQFILYLFPQNMEVAKNLSEIILGEHNFIVALLVFALLPAICEEIFFRGLLMTAFRKKATGLRAIILSSVLFGITHIDFIRMVPTAILGLTLGYAVYNTGSIFIPMLMHFLNNGIAIVSAYYPESVVGRIYSYLEMDFSNFSSMHLILLIVISIVLIFMGLLLLKKQK
ncbi:MAG: CPBP family intramembrane metalloprotease [Epulopiscium sp.]|nr:CPBP family intramembrane metalloprotease [Candidatus Epulonipiscium sp.]